MDIKVIFHERDGYSIDYHLHHAKSITMLCDCGVDEIIIENDDGSFEHYDLDPKNRMIRIEDISKGP